MKKMTVLILGVILAIFLGACTSPNVREMNNSAEGKKEEATIPQQEQERSLHTEDNEAFNDNVRVSEKDTSKSTPIIFSEETAYELVENLGWLLNDPGWNNVNELSSNDFIMWYGSYEAAQHPDDEFYMGKYLVDDKDGFYLPADEVESVVAKFFNVPPNVLRTDDLYNADDKVYTTSRALGPLPELNITINNINIEEDNIMIEFSLSNKTSGDITNHVLTVSKTTPNYYISYINQ